jgi:hypothetical protein
MARIEFELTDYCAAFCPQIFLHARVIARMRRKQIVKERSCGGYMPSDFMNGVSE